MQGLSETLATHSHTTNTSIKELENQLGQLAESLQKLTASLSDKLPTQAAKNPREDVKAVRVEPRSSQDYISGIYFKREYFTMAEPWWGPIENPTMEPKSSNAFLNAEQPDTRQK